jgi:starch phosphorylase
VKAEHQDNPVLPTTTGASDLSTLIRHNGHLADLRSYREAIQRLRELYADADGWTHTAIVNVAGSGKFSSDRTIAEYAADIWKAQLCPVP